MANTINVEKSQKQISISKLCVIDHHDTVVLILHDLVKFTYLVHVVKMGVHDNIVKIEILHFMHLVNFLLKD